MILQFLISPERFHWVSWLGTIRVCPPTTRATTDCDRIRTCPSLVSKSRPRLCVFELRDQTKHSPEQSASRSIELKTRKGVSVISLRKQVFGWLSQLLIPKPRRGASVHVCFEVARNLEAKKLQNEGGQTKENDIKRNTDFSACC